MVTAVVTGAAGDIGRAIVERLMDGGYQVEGWDLSATRLKENDEKWAGQRYVSRVVDLTNTNEVQAAAQAPSRLSPVQVLVNNAGGVTESVNLKSGTEADFLFELDLNLVAAWRCIQQFRPGMQAAGGGAVVNIASINGIGVYGYPGYSAAKAGLLQLTRSAAVELGKQAIRVNAVAPGSVRTRAWDDRLEKDPRILERAARWYPVKDVCVPADVAAAVAFLAGPDARMITGVTLPVDGGLSAGIDIVASELCQGDI